MQPALQNQPASTCSWKISNTTENFSHYLSKSSALTMATVHIMSAADAPFICCCMEHKKKKRVVRFSVKKRGITAQCMHNVETWGNDAPRVGIFAERERQSFIHPSSFAKNHHKTSLRAHWRYTSDSGAATAFQHHFNSVRIFLTAFVDLQRFHHRYYQAAHAQGCAVCNQVMEGRWTHKKWVKFKWSDGVKKKCQKGDENTYFFYLSFSSWQWRDLPNGGCHRVIKGANQISTPLSRSF